MRVKLALATATAIGMAMAGAAYAAGSNTLYLTQDGGSNTADIDQSHGPGGNDIGLPGTPALQKGNHNNIVYSNVDWSTSSDNDITALLQQGDYNDFRGLDSDGSNHNDVNSASQIGSHNTMTIRRRGDDYSSVGTARETGDSNVIYVYQGGYQLPWGYGDHNIVDSVTIDGSGNGFLTPGGAVDYDAGISLAQTGIGNHIWQAGITGSNNGSWSGLLYSLSGGVYSPMKVVQDGRHNGALFGSASMTGSNGNKIIVAETGDYNNFSVSQGTSTASTGNFATATQTGNYNNVTATQFGDGNHLVVGQISDNNSATANFTGDDNGVGTLTDVAGALAGLNGNLVVGTIHQDSTSSATGNSATYNVLGSSNLFAFAQIGGSNTITGTVGLSTASSNNQAVVLQTGNSNTASFSQSGTGSNKVAINQ